MDVKHRGIGPVVLASLFAVFYGVSVGGSGRATAETFVLDTGGYVTGKLLNPEQSPRRQFIVQSVEGGRVTLDVDQIQQIRKTKPIELEYEKVRHRYQNTPEDHWTMAEWCLKKKLVGPRRHHLLRICELDPNHAAARKALGHIETDNGWLSREEWMEVNGYQRFGGRYRTEQEVEMMKTQRAREKAEKEWYVKIRMWRGWIEGSRDSIARGHFHRINDPNAVVALEKELEREKDETMRLMYVKILGRIASPAAYEVMKVCALEDDRRDVRTACLEHLLKYNRPAMTEYYVKKLEDKENRVVNLAAIALGCVGDGSAVRPLIDALTTKHKERPSELKGLGQMVGRFSGDGSSSPGFAFGGSKKLKEVTRQNASVREALFALTGQNFGFDKEAWLDWQADQQEETVGEINLRRD